MPIPAVESFQALNAHLEGRCLERMDAVLRGHTETIGQRMERDLDALLPLPAAAYDACDQPASRVSSLSLVSRVNYICRLASISFAGSPPWPGPVAGQRWSGSWGRQTPG